MLRFFFGSLFLGMKFQSNLNEIDKFEQKSQADSSSKVYEWPSKDEAHIESKYKKKQANDGQEQTIFFYQKSEFRTIKLNWNRFWDVNNSIVIVCSVGQFIFTGGAIQINSLPFNILRIPLLLTILAIAMT